MTVTPHFNAKSVKLHERASDTAKSIRSELPLRTNFGRFVLAGWVGTVCLLATMSMLAASADRQRVVEATAKMERFTKTLSQARTIAPATARTIGEIIRRPEYDCTQVACDAAVERRNRAAREKLEALLNAASGRWSDRKH